MWNKGVLCDYLEDLMLNDCPLLKNGECNQPKNEAGYVDCDCCLELIERIYNELE